MKDPGVRPAMADRPTRIQAAAVGVDCPLCMGAMPAAHPTPAWWSRAWAPTPPGVW